MYKLSEDINKSVLFNEFMKKSFRTYHVIEVKKRYVGLNIALSKWIPIGLCLHVNAMAAQGIELATFRSGNRYLTHLAATCPC
jgi:hypothetical protein